VFVNRMPRYDVLSDQAMITLERGWQRLLSEIGVQFDQADALERFRQAGQSVEGTVVKLDPDFVLAQVAQAPRSFEVRARNPARSFLLGGDHMVFGGVTGPPFVRDNDGRREGTFADLQRFIKLGHAFPEIDTPGSLCCEPNDLPLDSRHLDMQYAALTLSDKPHMGSIFSGARVADAIAMAEIVFGGRDELERGPVMWGVANVNSPLRYAQEMIDVLAEYASANQAVVITPFLLMGAMSPVSIPAALAQQTAEFLAGVALAQLIRPGAPVVLGSFLSHTDMQSGSPGFGGPESAMGLLCSGQIARRLGLPWRAGGGGLTSSQTADAQAAYEAMNTMLPAFLSGANFVLHAAGWLESGLVASYEKYIIDIEILRILCEEFRPLEIDEASLAFDAHFEVGHGGHFFGAAHTLERFRECFYRPLVSSTANFQKWQRDGGKDAAMRAREICAGTLEAYEQPQLADDIRAGLDEYVERRRRELGD
jgi:trimethylamine--corrinoid protein Co-methyltransferase